MLFWRKRNIQQLKLNVEVDKYTLKERSTRIKTLNLRTRKIFIVEIKSC